MSKKIKEKKLRHKSNKLSVFWFQEIKKEQQKTHKISRGVK